MTPAPDRPARSGAPIILWFRHDLRLADNPAVHAAAQSGQPCIALHVVDEAGPRQPGGAARWWLGRSLQSLSADLAAQGVTLVLAKGEAKSALDDLIAQTGARQVVWTRRYDAAGIAVDKAIKADLKARGLTATSFPGHLLYEPWDVTSQSGGWLKVFTPFWRAARTSGEPKPPLPVSRLSPGPFLQGLSLESFGFEPTRPDWAGGLRTAWTPGEAGARARLEVFLTTALTGYAEGRNRPDRASTSRLSPHLRFGEISIRMVWHAAVAAVESGRSSASRADLDKFLAELGWREFAYHLFHHAPDLATRNFQSRFDGFDWRQDQVALKAWQRGMTGYPMVDAGMRELWHTGWMHNRVRMIVGSFLVKHLRLDWRHGEEWFWDTLVDADPANNAASWQWVAGTGADAAPYFRVFNPVLQGEKFDPDGAYVRRFVPELARMPAAWIHKPWEAPPAVLAAAGVTLGETYPAPIVDHAKAREAALAAFQSLKPMVA
jgi:deoxyribodipyrimidine photo-lyase